MATIWTQDIVSSSAVTDYAQSLFAQDNYCKFWQWLIVFLHTFSAVLQNHYFIHTMQYVRVKETVLAFR